MTPLSTPPYNEEGGVFFLKEQPSVSPQSLPLLSPTDSMTTAPNGAVNLLNLFQMESPHLTDDLRAYPC